MSDQPYFECLLLDLDGTLVDSRSLMISSIKFSVKSKKKKAPSAAEILSAYADTTSPAKILKGFRVYDIQEYWEHYVGNLQKLRLFDKNIKRKLGEISKTAVKIGVVTSLPGEIVKAILQHFKLSKSFAVVKSYERGSPKWKLIDKVIRELNVDPFRSIYVGDMATDVTAAKRADKNRGIWAGMAFWSKKKSKDVSEAEPDFVFQRFDDILELMSIKFGSEHDCFGPSKSCYAPHKQYLSEKSKIDRQSCRQCFFPADCLNCRRFSKVRRISPGKREDKRLTRQIGATVSSCEWYYPKNYPRNMIESDDSVDTRNVIGAFKKNDGELGFKFRLALSMIHHLRRLREDTRDYQGIDLIMPVPATSKKTRQRGYNPPAELSKVLSKATGIPVVTDSLRTTAKRPRRLTRYRYYWEDDKERLIKNIRIRNRATLAGKKILLVDDILTDGVTLSAYAQRIEETLHHKSKVVALTFGLTKKKRN